MQTGLAVLSALQGEQPRLHSLGKPRRDVQPPTPLFGERALWLPEPRAIVVGDLHVGLESDLRLAGVTIPSQTERMRARLAKLVERTGAKRIIVIGDLKHRIPYSTRQEERELPGFFADLGVDTDLVPGNHDVDLAGLVDIDIHEPEGIRLDEVGLLHGHTWPDEDVMRARVVVMCHNHPAVMLVDELGHRHKEACWVRARFTGAARAKWPQLPEAAELIVMPAFNELTGGTAFNAPEGEKLLGPLLNNAMVDVDGARLWTVDGVELGTIGSLRKYGDDTKRVWRSGGKRTKRTKRKPGWIE